MSILKNIFSKKEEAIKSNADFWNWFEKNEKDFYNAVSRGTNIEKDFFDKLSPQLQALKEGYFFLTGMLNEQTAELVLTADGNIKNIVFVEELVNAAPKLPNWKFTALKPATNIENVSIKMGDYTFGTENLFFYSNDDKEYPDTIDITVVHLDCNEENKPIITNGTYIFLDNYLGELHFTENIDIIEVIGKDEANKELIPIEKLQAFLIWRQKEFVEKYEGVRHNTENDGYSSLEATLNNGLPLIAVINSTLFEWDAKPSHPWILTVKIGYNGEQNNGFPDNEMFQLLNEIEDNFLTKKLKDSEGYLNLGRETADSLREIYFACKDFRKPSKVLEEIKDKFGSQVEIEYEIYKDKYWQSFNRYMN
ncbi:DUF695 domain-containing protein [Flavobacterium hydatis]|uniref:DUF695 domain-containing protein n=1 Tax=Flavobacterium hydatis TaxID=991 RepID=A0A086A183_FLAHY|nr:DUF695 domain-containing protein [Flavobacterium hydatis]KFF10447.1 hypothetical protein IW20_20765 [Flavobacterium hydatis]OXA89417.1 DUF695 domain-containing protein [Flavobacterium hydatis]